MGAEGYLYQIEKLFIGIRGINDFSSSNGFKGPLERS